MKKKAKKITIIPIPNYFSYKRGWLPGFRSSFNVFGTSASDFSYQFLVNSSKTNFDTFEIFSDWKTTGKDIAEAENNFQEQLQNESKRREKQTSNT